MQGKRSKRRRLKTTDKEEIRRRVQQGENPASVAAWYDVAEHTVRLIAGLIMD